MLGRLHFKSFLAIAATMFVSTGCNVVPAQHYHHTRMQANYLSQQNQSLTAQNQSMGQSLAGLQSQLDIANQRLGNLQDERSQLKHRYISLLKKVGEGGNPLSDEATRRFQELVDKYPGFEFDPHTGVSKFHSDILFASGDDRLKKKAIPILRDFADIMNDGAAQHLKILVVGHTDDKPIAKKTTRGKHATNWHLSTNRANSVVTALGKAGVGGHRMGAAGYSMHQPAVPNKNEKLRQRNRRVEIFVLAPDAAIAGWDPHTSLN